MYARATRWLASLTCLLILFSSNATSYGMQRAATDVRISMLMLGFVGANDKKRIARLERYVTAHSKQNEILAHLTADIQCNQVLWFIVETTNSTSILAWLSSGVKADKTRAERGRENFAVVFLFRHAKPSSVSILKLQFAGSGGGSRHTRLSTVDSFEKPASFLTSCG